MDSLVLQRSEADYRSADGLLARKNESGWRPIWDRVLLLPKEVEAKTAGGLIIPDATKDRDQFAQQEGEVIAIGPSAFVYDWPADRRDEAPKVGDTVFFSRYQGEKFTGTNGKEYWIIKDTSIAGVKE